MYLYNIDDDFYQVQVAIRAIGRRCRWDKPYFKYSWGIPYRFVFEKEFVGRTDKAEILSRSFGAERGRKWMMNFGIGGKREGWASTEGWKKIYDLKSQMSSHLSVISGPMRLGSRYICMHVHSYMYTRHVYIHESNITILITFYERRSVQRVPTTAFHECWTEKPPSMGPRSHMRTSRHIILIDMLSHHLVPYLWK